MARASSAIQPSPSSFIVCGSFGLEMNVLLSKFAEKDQRLIKQITSTEDPFGDMEENDEATKDEAEMSNDFLRISFNLDTTGHGTIRKKAEALGCRLSRKKEFQSDWTGHGWRYIN